jgi:hypothetical protein
MEKETLEEAAERNCEIITHPYVASGTKQFQMYCIQGPQVSATFTVTATTAIYPIFVDNVGGGDYYIWNAQRESGSVATSYIPTPDSAVTRLADATSVNLPNTNMNYIIEKKLMFIEGAKWQAERMYSEEEVLELLHSRIRYTLGEDYKEVTTIDWFEQFKKK